MRFLLVFSITLFTTNFQVKAQSLEGSWVVDKFIRNVNGNDSIDFDRTLDINRIDLSGIRVEFTSPTTYTCLNFNGQTTNGTYLLSNGNLSLSGDNFGFDLITDNLFSASKTVSYPNSLGEVESAIVTTIYIKESVLPVTLTSFSVESNNKSSVLSWESAIEENLSRFEVEKSSDRQTFHKIGEVISSGSDSRYNFEDEEAFAQARTVFYRLKMVDQDASFQYSQIKSINTTQNRVTTFPNPTRSVINYQQSPNSATSYKVLSLDGKLLASGATQDSGIIDLASLPKGVYQIIFLRGKDTFHAERIVKL